MESEILEWIANGPNTATATAAALKMSRSSTQSVMARAWHHGRLVIVDLAPPEGKAKCKTRIYGILGTPSKLPDHKAIASPDREIKPRPPRRRKRTAGSGVVAGRTLYPQYRWPVGLVL